MTEPTSLGRTLPQQQPLLRRVRRKLGSMVAFCFSWYRC